MSQSPIQFEALGAPWQLTVRDLPPSQLPAVQAAVLDRLASFDQAYSRFRPDSLVSRIAKQAGTYTLPEDAAPLMDLYALLYALTDGAMTPLIGDTLSDLGYDASYSLTEQPTIRAPKGWDDVLDYAHPQLTVSQPVLLDFGAAGKGYAVDLVAAVLRTAGSWDFTVDASGDLWHESPSSLRVGLEDPAQPGFVIGEAQLSSGMSLCASSGSRRQWRGRTHLVDPATLDSPTEIVATWVTAPSALVADGVSTALFFVDPALLVGYLPFEYCILTADRLIRQSPGFPGKSYT